MKIYGDTNSGNCLKVKWVCDRLALPYDWIDVDTMKRETRTTPFLKLNPAGQVPTVEFDDGRTLAQSNAIIRYLARGSELIPADAFAAARWMNGCSGNSTAMSPISRSAASRWSIWASPRPTSTPTRSRAAMPRWRGWSISLPRRDFWSATLSLADVSLLAYTRLAHEGGFHLDGYDAVRRWIGEAEHALGLAPAR